MKKNIEKVEVGSSIRDNMMVMSVKTITDRSLPFLEDGLKPSQRKVLYTMSVMGLTNKNAKCADIEGRNMKISAHGGSYDTLVRMTREKEVLLTPLIHGKGAFGKVYSSEVVEAAPRYTEARLAPICREALDTLHKHPNNMIDNYDNTTKEPLLLSLPFPNILANAQKGIAIGFACEFPSFNLRELCDSCISVLKGNKNIYKCMPAPDFTTGAKIMYDKEEIKNIYTTGRGKIILRAKFNDLPEENILEVLEIPYNTTVEAIMKAIQKNYDDNKLPEVVDVVDEIGINGFKMSIQYKKGIDVEKLIKKLYALTPLESNLNCNMNLIYNKRPYTMGVIEIIEKWIEHRKQWVQEEIDYDLVQKSHEKMLLEGLNKILLNIDKAVQIVKNSKNDTQVIKNLMKEFSLNEEQAEYVANIRLRNFNKDYILDKVKAIKKLEKEIKDLENTDLTKKLIDDLTRIKETYGIDRKLEIVKDWEPINVTAMKQAAAAKKEEGRSVVFTGLSTLRRMPENTTAKTNEGHVRHEVDNGDEVLLFTTFGRVFKIKVHTIKSGSLLEASSLLKARELQLGETIIYTTILKPEKDILIVFNNNKVARFSQQGYVTTGNRRCFKTGFSVKAAPVYIEALEEEKVISIPGYKDIKTNKYETKQSRTTVGVNIK
jgi:DNA gyrase subunit A